MSGGNRPECIFWFCRFILCCLCPSSFFETFNSLDDDDKDAEISVQGFSTGPDAKEKSLASFKKFCGGLEDEVYHVLR